MIKIAEKCFKISANVQQISKYEAKVAQNAPQMAPKWPQMALRQHQNKQKLVNTAPRYPVLDKRSQICP